ncbi:NADPH-dependent 7-cyano-7-deazaguanine reductase [Acinetobacter baumannii]|uniref:NADPH-dependent 7-cyano-7-deazaguanine reductase n=1 Tax=Acinetobacter baumannii TaxID=470 RepID=UPI000DD03C65|nr:NADPH-dependent 7-cyano-7-deazaguanine reductase [Acinetobacter baumannii]
MGNLLLISTILTAAVLAGCNAKEKAPASDAAASAPAAQANSNETTEKTVKYLTEDKQIFTLKTIDNFETATLEDSQGNSYALKNGHAASGVLLEGENGVSIHTKGQEGFIELTKGKIINIKEAQ